MKPEFWMFERGSLAQRIALDCDPEVAAKRAARAAAKRDRNWAESVFKRNKLEREWKALKLRQERVKTTLRQAGITPGFYSYRGTVIELKDDCSNWAWWFIGSDVPAAADEIDITEVSRLL